MRKLAAITFTATALFACGDGNTNLFVDIQTDLAPGIDFVEAQVEVFTRIPAPDAEAAAPQSTSFTATSLQRRRVAEFEGLPEGVLVLRGRLITPSGDVGWERLAQVALAGNTSATLIFTRACTGVVCPGPLDPASAVTCSGGSCVDPQCTPETPEFCSTDECAAPTDCPAVAECATQVCETGVCLAQARTNGCPEGFWCSPEGGCRPVPPMVDAGVDGGGGADSGAGPDAGPGDAGSDSGDAGAMDGSTTDAGSDAGGDSGAPVPAFDVTTPFVFDRELTELGTISAGGPTVSADQLEMYFNRQSDIWRTTRAAVSDPWTTPARVTEVNTTDRELQPVLSYDGLTLFFGRGVAVINPRQVQRSSVGGTWGAEVAFGELTQISKATFVGAAGADALHVLLVRRPALMTSSRPSFADPFSMPAELSELTPASDTITDAWTDIHRTVIVFAQSDVGGGSQLFVSTRPDVGAQFGAAVPLPGLSPAEAAEQPWLSNDFNTLYFVRDSKIYVARR